MSADAFEPGSFAILKNSRGGRLFEVHSVEGDDIFERHSIQGQQRYVQARQAWQLVPMPSKAAALEIAAKLGEIDEARLAAYREADAAAVCATRELLAPFPGGGEI